MKIKNFWCRRSLKKSGGGAQGPQDYLGNTWGVWDSLSPKSYGVPTPYTRKPSRSAHLHHAEDDAEECEQHLISVEAPIPGWAGMS